MIRAKIVFLITVVFLAVGFGIVYVSSPLYKATVDILIEKGLAAGELLASYQAYTAFVSGQKKVILSPSLIQKTIRDLHLDIAPEFSNTDIEKKFLQHIHINTIGDALIKISAVAEEPNLAIRMAQSLANNYVAVMTRKKYQLSEDIKDWLSKASYLAKEVSLKENKIAKFKAESDLFSLSENIKNTQKRIEALKEQKRFLEKQKTKLQKQYNQVRVYQGKKLDFVLSIAKFPELNQLRKEYEDINTRLEVMGSVYKESHPQMQKLLLEKNKIKEKIKEVIDFYVNDVVSQINVLKSQEKSIEKEIVQEQVRLNQLIDSSQQLAARQKEIDLLKESFNRFLNKIDKEGFYPINVSCMELTPEEAVPVEEYKNYTLPLLVAGGLGVFVGILISVLLSFKAIAPNKDKSGY